jgi:starch synthase (maltosyl-transferring)
MAIRTGAPIPEDWTRAAEVTAEHGLSKSSGESGLPSEGCAGGRVARLAKPTRAIKIYYFPYRLATRLANWPRHLEHCRNMGFDSLAIPPPFATDDSGNPFLTADFDLPNPALGLPGNADVLDTIARLCGEYGLNLIVDLVLDRVARGRFAASHPSWFECAEDGEAPPDPRRMKQPRNVALAHFDDETVAEELATWWIERLGEFAQRGVSGLRCLGLKRVPGEIWRRILVGARRNSDSVFLGWLPNTAPAMPAKIFDYVCSARFDNDYAALRAIAPVIAVPESPFGPRRARAGGALEADYRHIIDLAAGIADGILIPAGFELAATRPLDPIYSAPEDFREAEAQALFAFDQQIAAANARLDHIARLGMNGQVKLLTHSKRLGAILKMDAPDARQAQHALMVLSNRHLEKSQALRSPLATLSAAAGAAFDGATRIDGEGAADAPLAPGEVRVLQLWRSTPVALSAPCWAHDTALRAAKAPRIAIEAIAPAVGGGRFAVKRVVGDAIAVEADIFADGHEVLAASLLWRPIDRGEWSRTMMQLVDNDRWCANFVPTRVGRHLYAIEAWIDRWAGLRRDIERKRAAGQDVSLDIADAVRLIETVTKNAGGAMRRALDDLREQLVMSDEATKFALILAAETQAAMSEVDERHFLVRSAEIAVDVDRPQARFASWYEMFPRSASEDGRHGNFDDVISRLPAIAAMGFDVLYFPPIHPIGATNRKGRNNALQAAPDNPGSPYAIGSEAGGYTALHPQLGTFADFRRMRDAALAQGIELALDFAVQCSPDHPWLKEHPNWFSRRSDGSIRTAENPPKKYEDIVNPDFYAADAIPDLWLALRDALLFWIAEGIRIFRVDNPHTKPLPFWEWLITDIRARQPEVIFLAEAFTRPKLMYRLAKLGFGQSYTYFTWRNTKQELIDYLTELTRGPPREFFRPHFFVNTPDINPYFLQSSGRAGFLIRAVLAATLSGLWGAYSGFEICEAAALPGREEYLDSEKYQIRPRDLAAPGNIVAEITALNRIRRAELALQDHLGVTFYTATNDQILVYGKSRRADRKPLEEMVLIAVNLDPHHAQESSFELPLWEFGLPDQATLGVDDLMHGHRFSLTGKFQQIRLDPNDLPFAIWRLTSDVS